MRIIGVYRSQTHGGRAPTLRRVAAWAGEMIMDLLPFRTGYLTAFAGDNDKTTCNTDE
jgi:hypothetical protein